MSLVATRYTYAFCMYPSITYPPMLDELLDAEDTTPAAKSAHAPAVPPPTIKPSHFR